MTFIRTSAIAVVMLPALAAAAWGAEGAVYSGSQAIPDGIIPGVGQIMIPRSSIARPEDRGLRAHTHYRVLKTIRPAVPPNPRAARANVGPAANDPNFNTPASMACIYRLVTQASGCNPNLVSTNVNGGTKVIAIVDAFHNKTALRDLRKFSTTFGLPAPKLQIVHCSATRCGVRAAPPADQGWAGEIALDIQWAHAMAPNAKIILVEAHSNSFIDLIRAEDKAAQLVAAAGGGQVSNSWGGSDAFDHSADEVHFTKSNVVFFASTGDHKGGLNVADVEWPSTSPNVIAVGGTTILRRSNGSLIGEKAWSGTGGGLSALIPRPAFQNAIAARVGSKRGVPDIAADADPNSGAYVYCSAGTCDTSGGFFIFGGTSLASPMMAAMVNVAGKFRASTTAQNTFFYKGLGGANYSDIRKGICGNGTNGRNVRSVAGWDRCTGIGTPKGKRGL